MAAVHASMRCRARSARESIATSVAGRQPCMQARPGACSASPHAPGRGPGPLPPHQVCRRGRQQLHHNHELAGAGHHRGAIVSCDVGALALQGGTGGQGQAGRQAGRQAAVSCRDENEEGKGGFAANASATGTSPHGQRPAPGGSDSTCFSMEISRWISAMSSSLQARGPGRQAVGHGWVDGGRKGRADRGHARLRPGAHMSSRSISLMATSICATVSYLQALPRKQGPTLEPGSHRPAQRRRSDGGGSPCCWACMID